MIFIFYNFYLKTIFAGQIACYKSFVEFSPFRLANKFFIEVLRLINVDRTASKAMQICLDLSVYLDCLFNFQNLSFYLME